MLFGFVLTLVHRLSGVVPVLESLGHVKVKNPLGHLSQLPGKLSVVEVVFLDGLEHCSHDL